MREAKNTKYPLCVVSRQFGSYSQTFIRRHVEDLVPRGTTGIASFLEPGASQWGFGGSVLVRGSKLKELARGQLARYNNWSKRWFGLDVWKGPPKSWQKRVRQFVIENNTQVVLGEFLDVSHEYIPVFNDLNIRFFAHAHGYDLSRLLRKPEWQRKYRDYNKTGGIITITEVSKKRLESVGVRRDKIYVVPYGVEVPGQLPRRETDQSGKVRVLSVGRMVPKKAPLLVLESFKMALEICPNISLDMVGEGPLFDRVREYVKSNDLKERVSLHGVKGNDVVKEMMQRCDIFVQHSVVDPGTGDEEGLPVVILEAMAAGLPVVATRHAGIPEQVEDGVSGFIVNEGDTAAMAERVSVLARNPEVRRGMGEAGWRRARSLFSWDLEKARLKDILGL